jgi:D-3-phosphoglycerate dehydrogenase
MAFKVVKIVGDIEGILDDSSAIADMGILFTKKACTSEEDVVATAGDADYVLTIGHLRPVGPAIMDGLKKCRFVQTIGIGYDGIGVVNIPDYCTEEVSDHVMALILSWSRRTVQLNGVIKQGKLAASFSEISQGVKKIWSGMDRLEGKSLGLIGLGRISRAVVRKAKGFGMNLLAYDPYIPERTGEELGVKLVGLRELLRTSDIVSISVGLTSETKHMIGREQLREMKPGAYLINTSRGSIVDADALYEALERGTIAGAGLDVTDPDPLPPDSKFLGLDNLILTGHSAHASPRAWAELRNRPFEEVKRVLRGEWPVGLVNPAVKDKENCRGPVRKGDSRGA